MSKQCVVVRELQHRRLQPELEILKRIASLAFRWKGQVVSAKMGALKLSGRLWKRAMGKNLNFRLKSVATDSIAKRDSNMSVSFSHLHFSVRFFFNLNYISPKYD